MYTAILLSALMSLAIIVFHYGALRAITSVSRKFSSHFAMSITVVSFLFLLHLIEIAWYAAHIYAAYEYIGIMGFSKNFVPVAQDYFHIAASGYTTLGAFSNSPIDNLAILVDLTSLTGFMMLTWSATYYYNIFSNSHTPNS